MVAVTAEYISIGCNKITQAAAWGLNGTVAYAANSLVAIYYPLVSKSSARPSEIPLAMQQIEPTHLFHF